MLTAPRRQIKATIDAKPAQHDNVALAQGRTRLDLGTIPRSILHRLVKRAAPATAAELHADLVKEGNEATLAAVYKAIDKLRSLGMANPVAIRSEAEANAALASARAIAARLGGRASGNTKPFAARFEITGKGELAEAALSIERANGVPTKVKLAVQRFLKLLSP